MFRSVSPFTGITHITDAMGVSFTLIEGSEKAVLFDTGYGTEDVRAYVSSLTDKPLKVYLSHGHHDHMLGARWFPETFLCREDMEEFLLRSGTLQRSRVKQQAENIGVAVPADFLDAPIPRPVFPDFPEWTGPFESLTEELGGIRIHVIHVPGHTAGSIVVHVPQYRLLLTGDDWNPCTWMWFACSLPAFTWRENMLALMRELEKTPDSGVEHVLCSHQPAMRTGDEMKRFLDYMTDERMKNAPAVNMGAVINTHQISKEPEGWQLIFDLDRTVPDLR